MPPSDRPIIARALEKNPQRRYQSCTAFVDALLSDESTRKSQIAVNDSSEPETPEAAGVEDLPELAAAVNKDLQHAGQALLIGLGGTGADCVVRLRDRIDELRTLSPMVLHSVVIDLDAKRHSMGDNRQTDCLPTFVNINTPLRSAMEYRDRGTDHLKSISRRWIYNVPRSGETEGMRPLGRLALIDHAEEVKRGISEAIDRLASSAANQHPKVYIVGSLAGGSGSGMFVDVAHLVRNLLDDAGLQSAEILSLMTTGRLQGDASRPLVLHDTKAALHEVRHFLMPGNSYPGDKGAGWRSVPAARTPLSNTYLIAAPQSSRHPSPLETIVEYLWSDATAMGDLLASARTIGEATQTTSAAKPSLRSVGIIPLSGTRRLEEKVLAPSATRHLLRSWLGDPRHAESRAKAVIDRFTRRRNLSADKLLNTMLKNLGDKTDRHGKLAEYLKTVPAQVRQDSGLLEQAAHSWFKTWLSKHECKLDIQRIVVAFRQLLAVRLHDRSLDMASVIKSCRMLATRATHLSDHLAAHATKVTSNLSTPDSLALRAWSEQLDHKYAAEVAANDLKQLAEILEGFEQALSKRAMLIAQSIQLASENEKGGRNAWDEMQHSIREQFDPVLDELHGHCAPLYLVKLVTDNEITFKPSQIVASVSKAAIPLVSRAINFINGESSVPLDTSTTDTATSRRSTSRVSDVAESVGATATLSQLTSGLETSDTTTSRVMTIEEAVEAVRPKLLDCGGYQRLILVVGSKAEQEVLEPQVQQYHQGSLTTVIVESSQPMLIHEAQRIDINDVMSRLTALSGGESEISRRLIARSDVEWTNN